MSDATKPSDGGPAFPVGTRDISGMTLRDYFAAQALPWICQSDAWDDYADVAKSAYAVADAMLAERERRDALRESEGMAF